MYEFLKDGLLITVEEFFMEIYRCTTPTATVLRRLANEKRIIIFNSENRSQIELQVQEVQ